MPPFSLYAEIVIYDIRHAIRVDAYFIALLMRVVAEKACVKCCEYTVRRSRLRWFAALFAIERPC